MIQYLQHLGPSRTGTIRNEKSQATNHHRTPRKTSRNGHHQDPLVNVCMAMGKSPSFHGGITIFSQGNHHFFTGKSPFSVGQWPFFIGKSSTSMGHLQPEDAWIRWAQELQQRITSQNDAWCNMYTYLHIIYIYMLFYLHISYIYIYVYYTYIYICTYYVCIYLYVYIYI